MRLKIKLEETDPLQDLSQFEVLIQRDDERFFIKNSAHFEAITSQFYLTQFLKLSITSLYFDPVMKFIRCLQAEEGIILQIVCSGKRMLPKLTFRKSEIIFPAFTGPRFHKSVRCVAVIFCSDVCTTPVTFHIDRFLQHESQNLDSRQVPTKSVVAITLVDIYV